jgi:hypothetical protein
MPAAFLWFLVGWNLHSSLTAIVDGRPAWAALMFFGAACAWFAALAIYRISRQERP